MMEGAACRHLLLTQFTLPGGKVCMGALSQHSTHRLWIPPTLQFNIVACGGKGGKPHRHTTEAIPPLQGQPEETGKADADGISLSSLLTWKDDVGWMLTLACFQWSPWLPFRDQTGPSELVWPFCLRKAFSVPAQRRERSGKRS